MRYFLALTSLSIAITTVPALGQSPAYLRTVVGSVDLVQNGSQSAVEATTNYPIEIGDQIRVGPAGRLETVLPDSSILRVDANTQLRFGHLAGSMDSDLGDTLLHLFQGNVQIILSDPGPETGLKVETANATVEVLSAGAYRIFSDGKSWTQVIVRSGLAEIRTEGASTQVSAGQQVVIDGERSPRLTVEEAPPMDSLELWGNRLEEAARVPYRRGYVEPKLSYSASNLFRHGRWYTHDGSMLWRPHVLSGWRPYHSGWWIYTPNGLTWVSTEPWGWITYHYGNWHNVPGYGWVWKPGNAYTPGAVQWYWGPTHVGWYPSIYSSPYPPNAIYASPPFGHSMTGYRFEDHRYRLPTGWRDWTYCAYGKFGYRDSHRYLSTGAELANRGEFTSPITPGVLTTDTRGLTPDSWGRPDRVLAVLESRTQDGSRPISGRQAGVRRSERLSPLGAAAMGESSSSLRQSSNPSTGQTRFSGTLRLHRQWDPTLWRRQSLAQSRPATSYRRDGRTRGWIGTRQGAPRPGITRPSMPGISARSTRTRGDFAAPSTRQLGGNSRSPQRAVRPADRGQRSTSGRRSGTHGSIRGGANSGKKGNSLSGDRGSG